MRLFIEQQESFKKSPRGVGVGANFPTTGTEKPINILEQVPREVSFNNGIKGTARRVKADLVHLEITGAIRSSETPDRKILPRHLIGRDAERDPRLQESGGCRSASTISTPAAYNITILHVGAVIDRTNVYPGLFATHPAPEFEEGKHYSLPSVTEKLNLPDTFRAEMDAWRKAA